MLDFAVNSLGIHGIAGKIDIEPSLVAVDQFKRPDGKWALTVDMTALNALSLPENAFLDVTVKDNSVSFRREFPVGKWADMAQRVAEIELDRELKPSRSQVYLHFVDPVSARLYAATEELRLPVESDKADRGAAGASASFIRFDVDPDQELPVKAIALPEGPVISFGRMGPSSALESRSDFGFIGYALPGAIEKLVMALLVDEHNELCSDAWEVMKERMAALARFDSWDDLKSRVTGRAEMISTAEQCAEAYMKVGRLKHLMVHLHKNTSNANEVEA